MSDGNATTIASWTLIQALLTKLEEKGIFSKLDILDAYEMAIEANEKAVADLDSGTDVATGERVLSLLNYARNQYETRYPQ